MVIRVHKPERNTKFPTAKLVNEGHKQGDLGKSQPEKKESQEWGGVPGSGSTTGQTMEAEPVTELFLTSISYSENWEG